MFFCFLVVEPEGWGVKPTGTLKTFFHLRKKSTKKYEQLSFRGGGDTQTLVVWPFCVFPSPWSFSCVFSMNPAILTPMNILTLLKSFYSFRNRAYLQPKGSIGFAKIFKKKISAEIVFHLPDTPGFMKTVPSVKSVQRDRWIEYITKNVNRTKPGIVQYSTKTDLFMYFSFLAGKVFFIAENFFAS